jgi:hypothetical protein
LKDILLQILLQLFFMDVGYWWPTLFKDTHDLYSSCDSCQKIGGLKI